MFSFFFFFLHFNIRFSLFLIVPIIDPELRSTEEELRKQFEELKSQLGASCGVVVPESLSALSDEEKDSTDGVVAAPAEETAPLTKDEPQTVAPSVEAVAEDENKVASPPLSKEEQQPVAEEHVDETVDEKKDEPVKEESPVEEEENEEESVHVEETVEEEPQKEEELIHVEKPLAERVEEEDEHAKQFAQVVTPFVNDSFIIDDYDHHDAKKPLAAVVRTRFDGSREYSPPLVGGDECDDVLTRSSAVMQGEGIATLLPREMYNHRPPAGWKPVMDDLHLFELPRGKPEEQGNVCYECGGALGTKPRFCEYTARYFCHKCFPPGKKFCIPAKVVGHWDFEPYPINPRSYDYLNSVMANPTINIALAHRALYTRVPVMRDLRTVRQKLVHMKDFILTCTRLGDRAPAMTTLARCRPYHYTTVDVYALDDLMHADKRLDMLIDVLETWLAHIASCELCIAKGSCCEVCGKHERIFPFQLLEVVQCPRCKGIFHRACYTPSTCPKCKRLALRH